MIYPEYPGWRKEFLPSLEKIPPTDLLWDSYCAHELRYCLNLSGVFCHHIERMASRTKIYRVFVRIWQRIYVRIPILWMVVNVKKKNLQNDTGKNPILSISL